MGIEQNETTKIPILKEANPKDVALAQYLYELSPIALPIVLDSNACGALLSEEEDLVLRSQAYMHFHLASLDQLIEQLIAGTFGEHILEPEMPLPSLEV